MVEETMSEMREEIATVDQRSCYPNTFGSSYLEGLINTLKSLIDQIQDNSIRAKDLILKIARRLDEEGFCKRSLICKEIKKLLIEKIKQGKLTEKWIEECLPAEYKRKYIKSERSSLSKQLSKRQLSEVTVARDQISSQEHHLPVDDMLGRYISDKANARPSFENGRVQALIQENEELKDALRKQTVFQRANEISESLEFSVPKDKHDEIEKATNFSKNLIYLIFDRQGIFIGARPDV